MAFGNFDQNSLDFWPNHQTPMDYKLIVHRQGLRWGKCRASAHWMMLAASQGGMSLLYEGLNVVNAVKRTGRFSEPGPTALVSYSIASVTPF